MQTSFMLPSNGKATPQSVERKRRMAQTLMEQGMQTGPIGHWSQGLARMGQALVGGLASRKADQQDAELQAETKRKQMARQLVEDNWRKEGRDHEWGQDAFNNARMRSSDAMQRTQFQNQLDDRQVLQDQRAAQQGLYESMTDESVINQTAPGSHPGNMQGPMQPDWTPEQFNQAQMYAAGGDYGKAGELLNPIVSEEPYNLAPDNLRMQGSKVIAQGLPKKPDTVFMGEGSVPDSKLREELQKGEAKNWTELQAAASVSAQTAQDLTIVDELIGMAPQGPVVGRLAEAFPGVSSSGAALDSIVKRLAPTLRVPGSGATSDIEYEGMLRGYPALRNKPEANMLISQIMKSKAAINVERGTIISIPVAQSMGRDFASFFSNAAVRAYYDKQKKGNVYDEEHERMVKLWGSSRS